jgi:uncharacterized membrane protein YkoI
MRNKVIGRTAATLGTVAAIALAAGIVGSTVAASETGKSGETSGYESAGGPALPMDQIVAKLKEGGYGEIDEIEREHGRYEVKARGQDGREVKLYVDPKTGEILRQEKDD